ncbi:hypothetical protein EUGRSUZ_H03842 [Eucalyptus grandis]|uniref:Uncharacterized protein n=2 Tax=Eucalyptus grandis TaxID=71139 RepID=A0ACC3JUB3_EUCGR|nr:hypothetical protein EUGRSUZ_H03842 [Eucalyptus grandis]
MNISREENQIQGFGFILVYIDNVQDFNRTSFNHRILKILIPQRLQKLLPYRCSADNRLFNIFDYYHSKNYFYFKYTGFIFIL